MRYRRGFQAVLLHASYQQSQGALTETSYAGRDEKSTTKTPRCSPQGAPSPLLLPSHRALRGGGDRTRRPLPRPAGVRGPLPRRTAKRSIPAGPGRARRRRAPSTQNQAMNALVFLYKRVLTHALPGREEKGSGLNM